MKCRYVHRWPSVTSAPSSPPHCLPPHSWSSRRTSFTLHRTKHIRMLCMYLIHTHQFPRTLTHSALSSSPWLSIRFSKILRSYFPLPPLPLLLLCFVFVLPSSYLHPCACVCTFLNNFNRKASPVRAPRTLCYIFHSLCRLYVYTVCTLYLIYTNLPLKLVLGLPLTCHLCSCLLT